MIARKLSRRDVISQGSKLLLAPAFAGAVGSLFAFPEEAAAVTLPGLPAVVSSSTGLNLRSGPSATRSVLLWLANGTALSVTGTSSDWFKVMAKGKTGWVNSSYVRLTGGSDSVAIGRGNTASKRIALTFDAGSDLGYTEQIITTLEEYGVIASFGLTGSWVNAYPDYAAWIAADGHQLLNHTLNHLSYTGASSGAGPISPAKRLAQLKANESIIASVTGVGCAPYWRPPFGDYDRSVLRDVGALGYSRSIMWTVDSMGWDGWSASDIYTRVMDNSSNGAIVLMHVGSASEDVIALDDIIRSFKARGYRFGTVAQVIGA
jgi:peptidoglycan/xylan/chitin deacetylase (PgdA/CDA1 family)